jgi:uncharacterized protein YcaQ
VATLRRIGLVQIDSVNVLTRAHYLPLYSRLGSYDPAWLDEACLRTSRRWPSLMEYWAHEASILPVETHPLLRWRMQAASSDAWGGMVAVARDRPDLVAAVRRAVVDDGPVTAAELEARHGRVVRDSESWGWRWSEVKRALEYLFWSGEIVAAGRGAGFRRRYDVPERVLPPTVLRAPTPRRPDAIRALVATAGRALGVATSSDLRDYYRLPVADTRAAVTDLVESGDLVPVAVEGWGQQGYLHRDATIARAGTAHALLAPFDPLVWSRDRTVRLFGFSYRLEIYVPAHQRVHGYYVLPYLAGDELVARVDLKHERARRALLVRAAWGEPGAGDDVVQRLARSLQQMAQWLGADQVEPAARGDLARALAVHLR